MTASRADADARATDAPAKEATDAVDAPGVPEPQNGAADGARGARAEELAALEEQRDFLLRSLEDLERERAAGDVDEVDYVALRDDYTARAARVIRAIERATRPRPAPRGRRVQGQGAGTRRRKPMWQRVAVAGAVAAFAASTGLLVAQAAGRREAGETVTGTVRESTRDRLAQAVALASQRRFGQAIALEDEILEDQPDNVEARTYKGWFQILSGDVGAGMVTLIDAVEVDPEFPDAHAFLAVGFTRLGRPEAALAELDRLDELDPPAQITQLTDQLRTQLEAQVGSGEPGEQGDPSEPSDPSSSTPPG
jgi:tetratricopeptide (TPR) repeat protein